MKSRTYLLIMCFVIALTSCNHTNSPKDLAVTDIYCDSCNEVSAMLYEQFYYSNDSAYLDSSLIVIDKALHECQKPELYLILYFRKLSILTQKCEFDKAISYLDSIDLKEFITFPYLQNVYHNRLLAMKYYKNGDVVSRDSCINLIMDEISAYLTENRQTVDSILCEKDAASIAKSRIDFPVKQYFYYLTFLKGEQEINSIIDSLQQIGTFNPDYLERLRYLYDEDFMVFSGV